MLCGRRPCHGTCRGQCVSLLRRAPSPPTTLQHPLCFVYIPSLGAVMAQEEEQYHPKDAITPATRALGVSASAGLLIASVQATLTRRNIGALGTFTHYGNTIVTFGTASRPFQDQPCLHGTCSCRWHDLRVCAHRVRQPPPARRHLQRCHWRLPQRRHPRHSP